MEVPCSQTGQSYWWNTSTNETTQVGVPKPAGATAEPAVFTGAQQPEATTLGASQVGTPGETQVEEEPDDGTLWWRRCRANHLTGSEMYCLKKKGYDPHQFVLGNIAQSLGFMKNMMSNFKSLEGGANEGFREHLHDARQAAYDRMHAEALQRGGVGLVGTRLDMVRKPKVLEVVLRGTTIQAEDDSAYIAEGGSLFTTACSGNDLFCLLDSGFQPRKFVFGNEAYSRGLKGWLKSAIGTHITAGHVPAISDVFHAARAGALRRLQEAALQSGANFISGVNLKATDYSVIQEVAFSGTACVHPLLPMAYTPEQVRTCTFSEAEMWSLIDVGYVPVGLVTRTCVFSIGISGSFWSMGQEFMGGELDKYTALVQEARRYTMGALREDALELSPDVEVVGLDMEMTEIMPGLLEFSACGTAVEKRKDIKNDSPWLPPQALEVPRPTFSRSHGFSSHFSQGGGGGGITFRHTTHNHHDGTGEGKGDGTDGKDGTDGTDGTSGGDSGDSGGDWGGLGDSEW